MTGREPPIMMPRLPRVRSDTGGAIAAEGCRMRHAASTGPHHTEVCRAPRPQRRSGHVGRTDRTHLAGRLGEQPDLRTLRHALPALHRLQRGTDAGRRPCSLTLLTRRSTLGVAPPPLLEATTAWHAPRCALCAPACCGVLPWRAPPWTLAPPQDAGVLFRGARDGEKERACKPTRRGVRTAGDLPGQSHCREAWGPGLEFRACTGLGRHAELQRADRGASPGGDVSARTCRRGVRAHDHEQSPFPGRADDGRSVRGQRAWRTEYDLGARPPGQHGGQSGLYTDAAPRIAMRRWLVIVRSR